MKVLFVVLLLTVVQASIVDEKDSLRIFVFNCGQADCQLIVFPSGYSILNDVGEDEQLGINKNAEYVGDRIIEILGKKEIDVVVISHYHIDHIGQKAKGGIFYLIEEMGFVVHKYIDRDGGVFNGDAIEDCKNATIDWHNISENYDLIFNIICQGTSTRDKTRVSAVRELADICSTTQIAPPDEGAEVQILFRDAYGVKNASGELIGGDHRYMIPPISENDFSIALRIKYGDFVYSTCGDLSGYNQFLVGKHHYNDIETTVAPLMGEVDVYHSNHHGIDSSTNEFWIETLKPSVTLVSCRTNSVPQKTMKQLVAVGCVTFATNDCLNYWSNDPNPNESRIYNDDIVITVPTGSDVFYVSKKDGSLQESFKIKANKTPGKCNISA